MCLSAEKSSRLYAVPPYRFNSLQDLSCGYMLLQPGLQRYALQMYARTNISASNMVCCCGQCLQRCNMACTSNYQPGKECGTTCCGPTEQCSGSPYFRCSNNTDRMLRSLTHCLHNRTEMLDMLPGLSRKPVLLWLREGGYACSCSTRYQCAGYCQAEPCRERCFADPCSTTTSYDSTSTPVTAESGPALSGDAAQYAGEIPRAGQAGFMPNSQLYSQFGSYPSQYGSMSNPPGYGVLLIFCLPPLLTNRFFWSIVQFASIWFPNVSFWLWYVLARFCDSVRSLVGSQPQYGSNAYTSSLNPMQYGSMPNTQYGNNMMPSGSPYASLPGTVYTTAYASPQYGAQNNPVYTTMPAAPYVSTMNAYDKKKRYEF